MTIYYLLVVVILFLGQRQKGGLISPKKYCMIVGGLFALITGLRSVDVGSDTAVYYMGYETFLYNPKLTLAYAFHEHTEGLYYVLCWLFAHNSLPFWCLTLTVSVFFYFSVSRFIAKYSADCALSFLILMAFNFFQFSMTGIRQTIALGFVMLALYEALKDNHRIVWVLIFISIGYLFHNSCVICILMIPFMYMKDKISIFGIFLTLILLLLAFIYRLQLMEMILTLSDDTRFESYQIEDEGGGAGLSTYIVFLLIYLSVIANRTRFLSIAKSGAFQIIMLFFAVFFQSTVLVQPVMFRIAWYFAILLIVILPSLIKSVPKLYQPMASFGVYCAVLFMYLGITIGSAFVVPYKFFWQ